MEGLKDLGKGILIAASAIVIMSFVTAMFTSTDSNERKTDTSSISTEEVAEKAEDDKNEEMAMISPETGDKFVDPYLDNLETFYKHQDDFYQLNDDLSNNPSLAYNDKWIDDTLDAIFGMREATEGMSQVHATDNPFLFEISAITDDLEDNVMLMSEAYAKSIDNPTDENVNRMAAYWEDAQENLEDIRAIFEDQNIDPDTYHKNTY